LNATVRTTLPTQYFNFLCASNVNESGHDEDFRSEVFGVGLFEEEVRNVNESV